MRSPRSHRPSPALVIACIALFTSLGGTGYAATQLHFGATSAKAKSKPKPAPKYITASQANKLIAAYIAAHHIAGPAGPQGSPGANGTNGGKGDEGKTGPQGPGATQINDFQVGSSSDVIATPGPWKMTLACETSPAAAIKFTGPGSIYYTVSLGEVNKKAETVNNYGEIGGGIVAAVGGKNNQMEVHGFLTSGSTMEQFALEVTVSESFPLDFCSATGDTIPVS